MLCIMLAACASERLNIKVSDAITEEKIALINTGVFTKKDVIKTFGQPLNRLTMEKGETFFYKDFNLKSVWIQFDQAGFVTGYKAD